MTKTTRIVCLCILGAVGTLCGVSTINAPITEDNTEMITPTEPLRSAYIVADIAMQVTLSANACPFIPKPTKKERDFSRS